MNPNVTCSWDLTFFLSPLSAASFAQLQALRYFMTIAPQTFLELDHTFWSYPLIASIPVTVSVGLAVSYYSSGSLCDRLSVRSNVDTQTKSRH